MCEIEIHKQACGCVPFYYLSEDNRYKVNECNPLVLMNCSLPLNAEITGSEQIYCPTSKCSPACQKLSYGQRISYISYPVLNSGDKANTFKVFYKQRYNLTVNDRYLKDNLVSLEIFYRAFKMGKYCKI